MNKTAKALSLLNKDKNVKDAYDRRAAIIRVARLVKRLRKSAGLSQKQLAELINVDQSRISRLESYENDSMPNLETLISITHACGRNLVLDSQYSTEYENPKEELRRVEKNVQVGKSVVYESHDSSRVVL